MKQTIHHITLSHVGREHRPRLSDSVLLSSPSGKGRFFHFRFPALPLLGINKQSLPQEDPDAVMVDSPRHSDGSAATHDYQLPTTRESCSPSYANDTRALIGPSHCSTPVSGPLDHSSPKGPWERTYPDQAAAPTPLQSEEDTLVAAPSIPGLTPTASRESVCSIRRASSVHDMEGFGSNSKMAFRDRHASEGSSRTGGGDVFHRVLPARLCSALFGVSMATEPGTWDFFLVPPPSEVLVSSPSPWNQAEPSWNCGVKSSEPSEPLEHNSFPTS